MRVLKWLVISVAFLLSVIAGWHHWKSLELARRECVEKPLPDLYYHECVTARWLRPRPN